MGQKTPTVALSISSVILLVMLTVCGCSPIRQSQLKAALQEDLKAPWQVETLIITAPAGDKEAGQYPLKVEITPSQTMYKKTNALSKVSILTVTRDKGDKKPLDITAHLERDEEVVHYRFDYASYPYKGEGQIADTFKGEYVIKHSSDYAKLIETTQTLLTQKKSRKISIINDIQLVKQDNIAFFDNFHAVDKDLRAKVDVAKAKRDEQLTALGEANLTVDQRAAKTTEISAPYIKAKTTYDQMSEKYNADFVVIRDKELVLYKEQRALLRFIMSTERALNQEKSETKNEGK
jgi:hypothetical protein